MGVTSHRDAESQRKPLGRLSLCVSVTLWPVVIFALVVSFVVSLAAQAPVSSDWPQWRGPGRSGLSPETGLLREWPASGPPRVWSTANLGAGFGSVAVRGDRV